MRLKQLTDSVLFLIGFNENRVASEGEDSYLSLL